MKKLQFDAAPDGNILHTLDNTIRATVPVPDGSSDDYGYLAMKHAILAAYHGTEPLEFWYDGQEDALNPDACEGNPTVEIEPEDVIAEHFIPVSDACIRQEGAPAVAYMALDAIRDDEAPDDDGCVPLYELVYPADAETADFSNPDDIRPTGYGWHIASKRRV